MSTKATLQQEKLWNVELAPRPSNTGGVNHKNDAKVLTGVDWLGLTGYGLNLTEAVRSELELAKELAKTGDEQFVVLGGVPWQVLHIGVGKGACYMAYVLKFNGLTLMISSRERSPAEGGGPVCMLQAPGQYCCGKDPEGLKEDLKTVFEMCGFTLTRISVNRLDLHLDRVGTPMRDVWAILSEGRVVTRCRTQDVHMKGKIGGEVETVYIGAAGADTRLCIYDKALELSKNAIKSEVYCAGFNLDSAPEVVTRYEWRLNGEALREQHNCLTLDETFSRLRSIFSYLVNEWYRECLVVDKRNQQRSRLEPAWIECTRAAIESFAVGAERSSRPVGIPEPQKLVDQVKGCVASIVAVMGALPEDCFEALQLIAPALKAQSAEWRDKVVKRSSRMRSLIMHSFETYAQRRAEFDAETELLLSGPVAT